MLGNISFIHLIFYAFAAVALCAGIIVITVKNPVHSVLALVVTFFAMAGIWMILHAEFLSLILLLVYVGAVMTLFLFVVMMLNLNTESQRSRFVHYLPFGVFVVLLTTGLIIVAVGPNNFGIESMPLPAAMGPDYSNTHSLGSVLYTHYAYPFEIAGVLLLAAIIAAITLTFRGPVKRRVQNVDMQVSVTPEDRLRLIKMPPTVIPAESKDTP